MLNHLFICFFFFVSVATNIDTQREKSVSASRSCCVEFLQPSDEGSDESNAETTAEDVEIHPSDSPYSPPFLEKETPLIEETRDTLSPAQHPGGCFREDEIERDDAREQRALEKPEEGSGNGAADQNHEQDVRICRTNSDIWSEFEDLVCEVIEDEEKEQREAAAAAQAHEDGEEQTELDKDVTNTTEVREEEEEPQEANAGKLTTSEEKDTFHQEPEHKHRGGVDGDKEEADTQRDEHTTPPQVHKRPPAVTSHLKDLKENDHCETYSPRGIGRQLVVSKQLKVHQAKAVPVVPPKPQYCRITALTLRQQQQQRDRGDVSPRVPAERAQRAGEPARDGDKDGDGERPALLRESRRDGVEGAARDTKGNSPVSMCFDEAVAIATMRREKERVREGEAEGDGLGK